MKSLPIFRRSSFPWLASVCLVALLSACSLRLHPRHDDAAETASTGPEPAVVSTKTAARGLNIELKASPDPVKLGETRQINVTLTLRNNSKQGVTLKFETSQIIEILLREQATGKVVSQWSTEQTFLPGTRYVVIDPHERVEYNQPITSRDLKAGVTYSLEAYFIGHEHDLHASRPIIPLP